MKHDEILQAAKEAGFNYAYASMWQDELEHLAAIIEKRTVERCESVLMQLHKKHRRNHNHFHYAALQVAAIRKLGEQE